MVKTLGTYTDRTVLEVCCNCGMTFGMPKSFMDARVADAQWFYCPAGHSQQYTAKEDENKRLKRDLESAQARRQHLADQLEATERSLRAQKGQVTKLKRRAAKGVCPCCSRHFVNVERHVASQHPEFVAETT